MTAFSTRMGGRQRIVAIGSAATLTEAQAIDVARRVLAARWSSTTPPRPGNAPAPPTYVAFLDELWTKVAARWKASTRETMGFNRKH